VQKFPPEQVWKSFISRLSKLAQTTSSKNSTNETDLPQTSKIFEKHCKISTSNQPNSVASLRFEGLAGEKLSNAKIHTEN